MKPYEATQWVCDQCGKSYPHNEHGKRFAETCCLCRTCGKNPSAYTGQGTECSACHLVTCLTRARESVASATADLAAFEAKAAAKLPKEGP